MSRKFGKPGKEPLSGNDKSLALWFARFLQRHPEGAFRCRVLCALMEMDEEAREDDEEPRKVVPFFPVRK